VAGIIAKKGRHNVTKIKFENVTESLSVPSFYMAYRELGDKHKLWDKGLEELACFFDSLSLKNLRRVLIAFGVRAILTDEDRAEFYAGGFPGLLLLDVSVPRHALEDTKDGHMYVCPHCNRGVDADWLDGAGVSLLATLYVAQTVERIKKSVVEFCMVQPLEVCFPYSGKKRWHEADVQRILAEQLIADKLGFPEIIRPEELKQLIAKLTDMYGFDIEKWAETRARNIKQGVEREANFYAYKKVDREGEP